MKQLTTEVKAVLEAVDLSKSARMRQLYDLGVEVGEIAKLVGVRYNFVYNVISGEMRNRGIDMRKNDKGESVKDRIVASIKEGKECVEISKELRCNINMVYKYRKEMERGIIK